MNEKSKSPLKEKVEYEKGKTKKLEEQILKEGGGKAFDTSLIILDASLEVVKEVLFENDLITEDSYKLRFFKKEQMLLTRILGLIREIKKVKNKIIVPTVVPPRDMKEIKA